MNNILVVSGHPELTYSVANATILDEVTTALPDAKIRRLDWLYPDGKFNIATDHERVIELAEWHQVSMTEISLAWLLIKVTSPVVGAIKKDHVDDAVSLQLGPKEMHFLKETYQPHVPMGTIEQNKPQTKDVKQIWTR